MAPSGSVCGYCGAAAIGELYGISVCPSHADLPELEAARDHLNHRAMKRCDGHRHQWTAEDAHAVTVLIRDYDARKAAAA